MVSAICPNCKILLVEASSNSFANLVAAVDRAASTPARVAISNSYGGNEYSGEVTDQSHYNHPGVAITVSSGDAGFGVEFPASSQYVTAVGGTQPHAQRLRRSARRRGAARAAAAARTSPSRRGRPTPVLAPHRGRRVGGRRPEHRRRRLRYVRLRPARRRLARLRRHERRRSDHRRRSTRSPAIRAASTTARSPMRHTGSLFDVLLGSNGSCGGSYLCTAGPAYDGPDGQRLAARHRRVLSSFAPKFHERARRLAEPVFFWRLRTARPSLSPTRSASPGRSRRPA